MTTAEELVKQANAYFKKPVLKLGNDPYFKTRFIPTGVFPIDYMLGGGLPRGRFTEFYGNFSTLKSLIGLDAIASIQAAGGVASLVDSEKAFDPAWAASRGVNVDELILEQPDHGEEAVDVTEGLVRAGIDLVVWDSVAATMTKEDAEKATVDGPQPGSLARLMSRSLRKLNTANKNHTAFVYVNQVREKIGVTFGNNETTPGGRALPFYASHRICMRKAGVVKQEVKYHNGAEWKKTNEFLGQRVSATLEKSKLTSPHREVNFLYDFGMQDIDVVLYVVAEGLTRGIITVEGQTWSVGSVSVRGRENFIEAMRETPKAVEHVKDKLMVLATGSGKDSPGSLARRKKKAVAPSAGSPSKSEPASTPTAGRGGSRTTSTTAKRSTKPSSPPARRSPSTPAA